MTMVITHDGAPGHAATATETGWNCSCGAGTTWPDGESRPRSRATGGARRHLTAAARNNPATPAPAQDRERLEAATQAADSVRAMFRPATPPNTPA